MSGSVLIRPEETSDFEEIESVIRSAFDGSEYGYHGEAELVAELRRATTVVAFVALMAEQIVGHLVYSPVEMVASSNRLQGMGLGPVAVLPQWQRQGIGSQLIQHGSSALKERGNPFTVVVGDLHYYQRFHFFPASNWEIRHRFEALPQEVLGIQWESTSSQEKYCGAVIRYDDAFGPQPE